MITLASLLNDKDQNFVTQGYYIINPEIVNIEQGQNDKWSVWEVILVKKYNTDTRFIQVFIQMAANTNYTYNLLLPAYTPVVRTRRGVLRASFKDVFGNFLHSTQTEAYTFNDVFTAMESMNMAAKIYGGSVEFELFYFAHNKLMRYSPSKIKKLHDRWVREGRGSAYYRLQAEELVPNSLPE